MRRLAELLEAVESQTAQGGQVISYLGHGWVWLDLGPRRRREKTEAGVARSVDTMTAAARVDPRVAEGRILRFGGADWTVVAIEDAARSGRCDLMLERRP
ncbi:phage head completion protein [Brevundimonas sp.]|uniref:phage head completion protein n=1 Tax=Brevundimonas sp. TaxID=1871086 RepID=UPI003BABA478